MMLDTPPEKPGGRLTTYSGDERRWAEWSFAFRGYLALHEVLPTRILNNVEQQEEIIQLNEVPGEYRKGNCTLYHLLATTCTGRAQCYVRNFDDENGVEVWRRLARRFGGASLDTLSRMKKGHH